MKISRGVLAVLGCCLSILVMGCGLNSSPRVAGTNGATITPGTPVPQAASSTDWPMYHRDLARTGYVDTASNPTSLIPSWKATLDGSVYASPLVVNGTVIAATEGNTVYALDALTGAVQWSTHIADPARRSDLPCGNIDPLGITGTPVYDQATGLIFAVAETQTFQHILVGLDVKTGAKKVQVNADISTMDPRVHQQRGALTVLDGRVYVPYGGLAGDCGNYHGTVVGIPTSGQGDRVSWQVPTPREGGIWTPPGVIIDQQRNLYVSIGNGETTTGTWDGSDSVTKLTPDLERIDAFAPSLWPQDNEADLDLGSMAPVVLENGIIFAAGKRGQGYTMHVSGLGGVGSQLQTVNPFCAAYGGAAVVGTTAYIPCTDGVQQITVDANGGVTIGWKAREAYGSPIVGNQTVYSLNPDSGILYAYAASSGAVISSIPVGQTSRFATPALSGNGIYINTLTGITAVSITG